MGEQLPHSSRYGGGCPKKHSHPPKKPPPQKIYTPQKKIHPQNNLHPKASWWELQPKVLPSSSQPKCIWVGLYRWTHGGCRSQGSVQGWWQQLQWQHCHLQSSQTGLGHSHCWFLTPTACMSSTDGSALLKAPLMQNAVTKQPCRLPKNPSWNSRGAELAARSTFLSGEQQNLSPVHHWQALCSVRRQRKAPSVPCGAKAGTGSYCKHCTAVIFYSH